MTAPPTASSPASPPTASPPAPPPELPELPCEVERLIMARVVSHADQRLARILRDVCPRRAGSTANAFFAPTEKKPRRPVAPVRTSGLPLPNVLHALYGSYDDETEFSLRGVTFLSEREMRARSPRGALDLAYEYAGMGHVLVHAYVPSRGTVVSLVDGGANGHDRAANHASRRQMLELYALDGSEQSIAGVPFHEWCEQKLAA